MPRATMRIVDFEIIVFSVLTLLPPKDVARCKSVCKEWRMLLSSHAFEKEHCSHSSKHGHHKTLLTRGIECSVYEMHIKTGNHGPKKNISFPFQTTLKSISILGHHDGLLCVCLHPTEELLLWNPTTTKYKYLSTSDDDVPYKYARDTIGLFNGPSNDYNVLHVIKSSVKISARIYSRRLGSWREVQFKTKPEYAKTMYLWSTGTLCSNTLYFVVSEYWNVFMNVVVAFDTITEEVRELSFPLVPPDSIFEGVLATIQHKLHMILTTIDDTHKYSITLWSLDGENWINNFSSPPVPPIPFSTRCKITHYITNGRWFIMSGPTKIYEFPDVGHQLTSFYAADWFRGGQGAVYTETLVSPSYSH